MKKLGFISIVAIAALSFGLPAAAGIPVYPPLAGILTLDPSTTSPNSSVAATFTGCTPGEIVDFTLNGATVSSTCTDLGGATATLTAPGTAGAFPVVAVGGASGATATAILTVVAPAPAPGTAPAAGAAPSGGLPQTGGETSRTVQTAAGLVAVGAGLTLVGGLRRRKHVTL